jgi:surface protein
MGSTRAETSRRSAGRSALISRVGILLAVLVLSGAPIASAAPFADKAALEAAVASCLDPTWNSQTAATVGDPTGVACCSKPDVDCGAAGTDEMPDWDVSLVTDMSELFMFPVGRDFNADISRWDVSSVTTMKNMFKDADAFNQDIGAWNTSSVTTMYGMFTYTAAFNQDLSRWDVSSVTDMGYMFDEADAFNQHLSRWDVSSVTKMHGMFSRAIAFNTMPVGWDTSKVTGSNQIFYHANAWNARFEGGDYSENTLPGSGWTRKDNACDASLPPVNGAVGNCTDTLVSGTSCVPECLAGYVLKGVTLCTDRVLTEATCEWQFIDGAELKATVDACLDAVPSGDRCCSSDRLCWLPDPAMRRCGAVGCSDMPDWDVSQVADAHDLFAGRSSFIQGITGWTFADNANTTGMFTGADAWLSRGYRTDGSHTTDGPPAAWVASGLCLMNEHVQSGWCVACGAGKYNGPDDDPSLGVDTRCDAFVDRTALKTAVDNCLAIDATGVACCDHGADCGIAGTTEMPDWDVSLVTGMSSLFFAKGSFNADISRWDTSSVTTMQGMFRDARAFNQDIGTWDTSSVTTMQGMFRDAHAFNQHLSRWDVSSVTTMWEMFSGARAFNTMPVGWDTSKVTNTGYILYQANAWYARFEGGSEGTLPSGWTRKDNACDASLPPFNGAVGTCIDTLVSGTSCVPTCNTGYVLEGVTSCTDRVLTEAVCIPEVTTRAELKAAVDACVGDRFCELTMPHWDVSQVTDMSFLFQGKTQFNVDISQWEMSQVTDASGMFDGASSFHQDIRGWTLASGADTTEMFAGADTWLSLVSRADGSATTDGPPAAWVASGLCLMNEHVQSGWCVACGAGKYNGPDDDPSLGVDTRCDAFVDSAALKTAVNNCLAIDATGVACCSQGADCGAAGTVEMPLWDVSQVTSMSELFYYKGSFNADISRWDTSSVTTMYRMFAYAEAFNQDIGTWDTSSVTTMKYMFWEAYAFNQHLSRWDVSSVTTMWQMFYDANAFNTMPVGWDTSKVTGSHGMFYSADAWYARFEGGSDSTLPGGGWTRKDNACDASLAPLNGDVGNCTDTLVSGTSCVPTCDTRYELRGVTSCTDRVLTRAICAPMFTSRTALKTAVDACLAAVPSGEKCCSTDPHCANALDDPTAPPRCANAGCSDMPEWNTEFVTDMSALFQNAHAFNQDIGNWDVSSVTDMRIMFGAAAKFDGDLSNWDVSSVTDMSAMFLGAVKFQGKGLSRWDVRGVTSTSNMFNGASMFRGDITAWDLGSGTSADGMFDGATAWQSVYVDCSAVNCGSGNHEPDCDLCGVAFHGAKFPTLNMASSEWTRRVRKWAPVDHHLHISSSSDSRSAAVSTNGKRIALAADGSQGSVARVYELRDGAWTTQIGSDIAPFSSLHMSAAGNRVVVGPQNCELVCEGHGYVSSECVALVGCQYDQTSSECHSAVGPHPCDSQSGHPHSNAHVTVYGYHAREDAWLPVGGEDFFGDVNSTMGHDVALSMDGSRVAMSAIKEDDVAGNHTEAGLVRVYEWRRGEWVQLGQDLRGVDHDERFGATVSLSNDGARLVVASGAGFATAYRLDLGSGRWRQMGDAFPGNSATRACISGDGGTVAVGVTDIDPDPGYVEAYRWSESDEAWTQVGERVRKGEGDGTFARTVSLSHDGETLSVTGVHTWTDDNGDPVDMSYAAVLRWNSFISQWDTRGSSDISMDGYHRHAALSGDGRVLVAGAGVYALSCDASAPPAGGGRGGDVGDCTASLAPGETCTPTCGFGFDALDATCSETGRLTPGSCASSWCEADVTRGGFATGSAAADDIGCVPECVASNTCDCAANEFWDGSACASCPSGSFSAGGAATTTSCSTCTTDEYWDGQTCGPPPGGSTSNEYGDCECYCDGIYQRKLHVEDPQGGVGVTESFCDNNGPPACPSEGFTCANPFTVNWAYDSTYTGAQIGGPSPDDSGPPPGGSTSNEYGDCECYCDGILQGILPFDDGVPEGFCHNGPGGGASKCPSEGGFTCANPFTVNWAYDPTYTGAQFGGR